MARRKLGSPRAADGNMPGMAPTAVAPPVLTGSTELVDLDVPMAGPASPVSSPPVATLGSAELVDLDAPAPPPPMLVPVAASVVGPTELVDLDAPAAPPVMTPPPPRTAGPNPVKSPVVSESKGRETEPEDVLVTIRSATTTLAEIPSRKLRREAVKWSQIVKNRERWSNTAGGGVDLAAEGREVFRTLGLGDDFLREVAGTEVVEVSIPFCREEVGWEARIFPWEALLSAATKPWRSRAPFCVVRHLDRADRDGRAAAGRDMLYIESIPAALRYWDFEGEWQRVDAGLPKSFPRHRSINESRGSIAERIAAIAPGLVHVAGFDTWQGASLLGLPYSEERRDGLMLSSETGGPDEMSCDDLFAYLLDTPTRPWLVSLNMYNSAARLAALAVAGGARAAIGFQDIFDDDLAEVFFARMYKALRQDEPGSGVLRAFVAAQESLQKRGRRLNGSGIVLWSEETITGQGSGDATARATLPAPGGEAATDGTAGGDAQAAGFPEGWPFATYKIKPYDKLNYSMLHNKSDVFENFVLCRGPGLGQPVRQVTIRAELYLGLPSPCSWEQTTDIEAQDEPSLHTKIRLPLISDLQRSLRHTLKTNLKVRIEHDKYTYYQETFPVELLAIDEWRDDDLARAWLPSFVMPGDPVVPGIVDAAQRYLTALVDEEGAGFDGYQRLGEANPARPDHVYSAEEVIDPQARAIWSSLWQEFPLKYINQPPTYTRNSQRIRPPSAVIAERRGTCIDLALVMASCLEHADLYPVMFLLRGHALPGYWRDPVSQRKFTCGLGEQPAPGATLTGGTSSKGPGAVWFFDQSNFPKIRDLIDSGALVPIETVGLTRKWGFGRACAEAKDKITPQLFEAMMDVRLARDHDVTPLPMSKETAR